MNISKNSNIESNNISEDCDVNLGETPTNLLSTGPKYNINILDKT